MSKVQLFSLSVGGLILIWIVFDAFFWRRKVVQSHHRGRRMRNVEEVGQLLARLAKNSAKGIQVGRQKFPEGIATHHIAFVGATGSGKTLLQRLLMQSVLAEMGNGSGTRAVVYDAKQDIYAILAGMKIRAPIHIMNPLDSRSVAWDMAADITSPASALQAASTLVPESKGDTNPFFTKAARQLFFATLVALIEFAPGRWTLRHLLLILRNPNHLQSLIAQSRSSRHLLSYFSHQQTALNIGATILNYTTPYEIIAACMDRAGKSISLSEWIHGESILVLGNDEENREAIDTINRLLFRRLAELSLGKDEEQAKKKSRTWFFLDEVREAGKLDLLGRLLTKGRSKGVAVSLGFQDISGMREAYGRELADELVGQCNTKVILRLNSPETAQWAANLFGKREILETRRGHSRSTRFGLRTSDASSGVSVSHAVTQQPLVLDSEILGLPETSREHGLDALFINPLTGPFEDHLDSQWLDAHLLAGGEVENFVGRPTSHQFLRPWDPDDDAVLGFATDSENLATKLQAA